MNELFVFVKLINGDQMMAIKESETEESLTLKFPMQIRLHKVLQNEKLSFGGNNTISILVK